MEAILEKFNISDDQFTWFDCERFDNGDAYINLFQELIRISINRMLPEKINWQEGWSIGKAYYLAQVSFELNLKLHTIKVRCDEWFDPDLIIKLNSILGQNSDFEERFYPIETGDQTLIIAFLNNQQYSELEKNNLIANLNDYMLDKSDNWDQLQIEK